VTGSSFHLTILTYGGFAAFFAGAVALVGALAALLGAIVREPFQRGDRVVISPGIGAAASCS